MAMLLGFRRSLREPCELLTTESIELIQMKGQRSKMHDHLNSFLEGIPCMCCKGSNRSASNLFGCDRRFCPTHQREPCTYCSNSGGCQKFRTPRWNYRWLPGFGFWDGQKVDRLHGFDLIVKRQTNIKTTTAGVDKTTNDKTNVSSSWAEKPPANSKSATSCHKHILYSKNEKCKNLDALFHIIAQTAWRRAC